MRTSELLDACSCCSWSASCQARWGHSWRSSSILTSRQPCAQGQGRLWSLGTAAAAELQLQPCLKLHACIPGRPSLCRLPHHSGHCCLLFHEHTAVMIPVGWLHFCRGRHAARTQARGKVRKRGVGKCGQACAHTWEGFAALALMLLHLPRICSQQFPQARARDPAAVPLPAAPSPLRLCEQHVLGQTTCVLNTHVCRCCCSGLGT